MAKAGRQASVPHPQGNPARWLARRGEVAGGPRSGGRRHVPTREGPEASDRRAECVRLRNEHPSRSLNLSLSCHPHLPAALASLLLAASVSTAVLGLPF